MNDTMLLLIAVAVFSLMTIGIVLTILEFSRGEPRQQDREERSDRQPGDGARNR
jgi:hypothetical protein